jgi:hypothetical protein
VGTIGTVPVRSGAAISESAATTEPAHGSDVELREQLLAAPGRGELVAGPVTDVRRRAGFGRDVRVGAPA